MEMDLSVSLSVSIPLLLGMEPRSAEDRLCIHLLFCSSAHLPQCYKLIMSPHATQILGQDCADCPMLPGCWIPRPKHANFPLCQDLFHSVFDIAKTNNMKTHKWLYFTLGERQGGFLLLLPIRILFAETKLIYCVFNFKWKIGRAGYDIEEVLVFTFLV